jgi:hypothetical protein
MYQTHDSVDSTLTDSFDYHDQDLPDSPDHWSLDDFGDILPVRRSAS